MRLLAALVGGIIATAAAAAGTPAPYEYPVALLWGRPSRLADSEHRRTANFMAAAEGGVFPPPHPCTANDTCCSKDRCLGGGATTPPCFDVDAIAVGGPRNGTGAAGPALTHLALLGERSSGTNFLEAALRQNLRLEPTAAFGFKHFFGFHDYADELADRTLFVGIVREPYDWVHSLFSTPHHLPSELRDDQRGFLERQWWSYNNFEAPHREFCHDRNMLTGERYQSIFEMRRVKTEFLERRMPALVKNYVLVRYEELTRNYAGTMRRVLAAAGGASAAKEPATFPQMTDHHVMPGTFDERHGPRGGRRPRRA